MREMDWKRNPEGKSRLTLPLELAIIVPAAALILVSAMHLRTIHQDRTVEAAIERDFHQVLSIGEKKMNEQAYELLDDMRLRFPAPAEACEVTLDTQLASHPYAAHAFLYNPTAWPLRRPIAAKPAPARCYFRFWRP